jgi:hypothetical protein
VCIDRTEKKRRCRCGRKQQEGVKSLEEHCLSKKRKVTSDHFFKNSKKGGRVTGEHEVVTGGA